MSLYFPFIPPTLFHIHSEVKYKLSASLLAENIDQYIGMVG